MRAGIPLLLSFFTSHAIALDCKTVADDVLRLACYDRANGKDFSQPAPVAQAPAISTSRWGSFVRDLKLADESTPRGLGSDPATFSAARRDGEEYTAVKAALVWESTLSIFPVDSWLGRNGWGPSAAVSVNRNTLVSKLTDNREASVGLSGIVFEFEDKATSKMHLGMYSRLSAGYRENKVQGTHSTLFKLENAFTSDYFRGGIPFETPWAVYFVPRLGLLYEDIHAATSGAPTGEYTSMYGVAKLEIYPTTLSDRLKFTATAQRFNDLSAQGGLTKRRETFAKVGIEYLLYSPTSLEPVQPSLALERTTGADPLNGALKFGQTQIVFKLRIN
jgi:hypothetical protein